MIRKDRLIQAFLDLVAIDSPSGEEEAIAQEVMKRLKALGGKPERDAYGNIITKFAGIGEPFLLNAHLDTVEPGRGVKSIIEDDRIRTDGTTILGADPKAGVAVILEALTALQENKASHVPLEVIFTVGEENGLTGSTHLDYHQLTARHGLAFDGEGGVNNITTSGPGYNRVDVTITGKAAHAGMEPEKGISAIKIAAEIIAKMEVGRIDNETTANIGLITGGTARNAVPEQVHFQAEIRSRNLKKLEQHALHFEQVFASVIQKYPEANVQLSIKREFNPFLLEEQHALIQHVKAVQLELGLKPKLGPTGGGSDVNIFHTHGIESVVVGTGGYELHTTKEYLLVSEMFEAAKFCEKLIKT